VTETKKDLIQQHAADKAAVTLD